jgi:enoyl-CoA hydratase/carnithine racemase
MSDGGDFRLELRGHLAILTLDRTAKRNALTPATLAQLERLADEMRLMEEVRAVVIRAEGPDFSVGADLNSMGGPAPTTAQIRRTALQGGRLMRALQGIDQPTICAVQGIATGGATCIATACDFRIAAAGARMGYGEVKLGINLMWNAVGPCVHLVGPARAKRLIMSGGLIPAETLLGWGFIDEIVEPVELDARAIAMAEEYAALPPVAVQMIKRSINAVAGPLDAAILHADADQWLLGTRTQDFREAIGAFREKRVPSFKGD